MVITVVDNYPKISEQDQRLRRAIAAWEDGKLSDEELERVYDEVTQQVIAEQIDAGVELLTDGQIRWDDALSYLARKLEGTQRGGLLRWFDNNFYFRQPVVVGKLLRKEPLVLNDWLKARQWANTVPVKPVLTGPYTFAKFCLNQHYANFEDLLFDVAAIWNEEAKALADAGAKIIQLNEPAVLFHPEDSRLWIEATKRVIEGVGADFALYTFFADASRVWDPLMQLPVKIIGLDFCSGEENRNDELVKSEFPQDKILGFGIVDARNIKPEPVDELAREIEWVASIVGADRLHVNPNCGLEFLPRADAKRKLETLAAAVRKVRG
ncbi:MAG: methylcobamide--CoM methyltransferase [Armatimonadetes bacterium]|nr:methylcobamide--CoM methyltransferase [Armatimonadota bacterium]MCX7969461.1 methylcobamide--CoM methyltransferase [Armatimonadota bacterium]MDW8142828.1 methylcobamide--CoM methyltransferase [Armatimonadota bacterium]